MDWGALGSRDAVLAICEHFDIDFAQARDHLLARQLQQAEERAAAAEEVEEEEDEEAEDQIIPMPGQDLVSVSATVVGTGDEGFQDGAAAAAMFDNVAAMLHLPDGRVLVADEFNQRIRVLSADLQQVSTVAGDGEAGYQDGAAAQAQFFIPNGLALLPDGRVLMVDRNNHRIRMLSADLQQVSTVAGDGAEEGHRDAAAAQAQFKYPSGLALLPDGRVLVVDQSNHRIRMLSAELQHVSTVAGNGERGHLDGAAAQAQFNCPSALALLPDGRVLVTDYNNHRIRMLSADLQQVSTVSGDGEGGHRDGAVVQARFHNPTGIAKLPDGRVLVEDYNANTDTGCIRVLSADLQQVSTLTNVDELNNPTGLCLLPDGRLLVGDASRIRVLEGFPAALLGTKPSHKKPKKTKQQLLQETKKRALAGGASASSSGASSCGPVPKRNCSGARSSAAAALSSSDDSEGEEQPGGSAAEAEPLV
jgi:sugar lactone lactonase YvrE